MDEICSSWPLPSPSVQPTPERSKPKIAKTILGRKELYHLQNSNIDHTPWNFLRRKVTQPFRTFLFSASSAYQT